MEINLSDSLNIILQERKSIYPYQYESGAAIEDEIVEKILLSAAHAPNHKKTEPWRLTVFSKNGRQIFADFQTSLYKKYNENAGEVKLKKLQEYPLMASHIITIGMKSSGRVPQVEELLAMGCAIENMFLTATSLGVGCYLSTGGVTYIDEAKNFFGLSENDLLIGFFYIGKIKKPVPPMKQRGSMEDKVTWISS